MKRILFVDDQPELLVALKRMLRSRRTDWDLQFAESGTEALSLLDRQSFDVVVSDGEMPVMDGLALLTEVQRRSPQTARIILSGSSQEDAGRLPGPSGLVHRFLCKPCNVDLLTSTIENACTTKDLSLHSEVLP